MELSTCFASPEIYYSLACFTYILSGVFGAIIRWRHMCHPYSEQGDYFYPARRQVTFFYGAVVLQFPYVLCPSDPDAWFFARSFGIIFYPICFAVLFFRYFRMNNICNIQDLNKKALYNLLFILPFLLLIVMFFFVTFRNGDVFTLYQKEWEYGLGGISLLLSYGFMRECWWLSRKLDNFNIQNYSNEDDFPYAFAKKEFRLPLIGFTIMWIVFLSESREVYMCVNILMAMFMVFFLCQILHPNKAIRSPLVKEELECMEKECLENIMRRNEDFKPENSASSETDEKVSSCQKVVLDVEGGIDKEALLKQMAEKDWEAVKKEVLTIVSRRYLEPSLKRVDVIRDVTLMKHTLAGTFITQVGFYKLVNAFRVRHYERLMETSNSNLSQDMAAELCGFKNRWALSNARKRLEGFDYSLIEEYVS